MKRLALLVVLFAWAVSGGAANVERIFRPERFVRGDTNVRKQQEIDEASWVWQEGLDVWGAAIFTETRPKGLETVPSYFVKFRKDFDAVVAVRQVVQDHGRDGGRAADDREGRVRRDAFSAET